VVGKDGSPWVGKEDSAGSKGPERAEIATALRTGKHTTRLSKETGLLSITSPLFGGGQVIGVVQVPVRIDEVVQGLRRSQLLIWLYIGLNVLFLLLLGNFLLSRVVIQPIKRLVKIAEHFEETDLFSVASETDRSEITHLSVALSRMLKRLSENRERMEDQIRSLQRANRELKQAREEILRSEKLSSIGRLAAGVAHEVGNPIGAILGYTNLLTAHVEGNEEARDYLTRIEKEITRINTIVRELLDFSRPSASEPTHIDVNGLVEETVSFFSHQKLMASVEVETHLGEKVAMVWADPDQLKQVLINLMFNACDAMEDGGRLTIAARQTSSPEAGETESDGQEAEVIEIAVSDTGKGIPSHELKKIFDPFYTTKPPGKGTGLGLAISLRIVESFGGGIHVRTVEGQGTTFTIRLLPYSPNHHS
jgi:signal transduction histidine kinase